MSKKVITKAAGAAPAAPSKDQLNQENQASQDARQNGKADNEPDAGEDPDSVLDDSTLDHVQRIEQLEEQLKLQREANATLTEQLQEATGLIGEQSELLKQLQKENVEI
ncbi:MAG: hypothetical protein INR69_20890, partial [Mucilaginibacter polytrichastri]|nr:hypothetical protein [Mucilaginibacter polytrichastri]